MIQDVVNQAYEAGLREGKNAYLNQTTADAIRKVTTYLAEEFDDYERFLRRGGDSEDHIAHYVALLEELLDTYEREQQQLTQP